MSMEITTIVEEELLPNINVLVGVDADPVVAGHHQDLHLAVGFAAVVSKPYLATHPGSINTEVLVQVEHVGALGLVVHLAPPLRLLLADHLAHILRNKLIFCRLLSNVASPPGNVARRHIQFLTHAALQNNVSARAGGRVKFKGGVKAGGAEVWIALPRGEIAGASIGYALLLALAARETVGAVDGAVAELLAEVADLPAAAHVLLARLAWVVARRVGSVVLPLTTLAVALVEGGLLRLGGHLLGFGRFGCSTSASFCSWTSIGQAELVHLSALLGDHSLRDHTPVGRETLGKHPEKGLLGRCPHILLSASYASQWVELVTELWPQCGSIAGGSCSPWSTR